MSPRASELAERIGSETTGLVLRSIGRNQSATRKTISAETNIPYSLLEGILAYLTNFKLLAKDKQDDEIIFSITRKGYLVLDKMLRMMIAEMPSLTNLIDMDDIFVLKLRETEFKELLALPEETAIIIEAFSEDPDTRSEEIRWIQDLILKMYQRLPSDAEIPTIYYLGPLLPVGQMQALATAGRSRIQFHVRF